MCRGHRLQRYSVREIIESFINGNRSFVKEYVADDTAFMAHCVEYFIEADAMNDLYSFLRLMKS
jgi:hypothetical protein